MTDTELYLIVKDHRESWPKQLVYADLGHGDYVFTLDKCQFPEVMVLVMEAAFHRALLERGDVYTHHIGGTYTVQTGDHDFTGGSLIEAYAKALEWLK